MARALTDPKSELSGWPNDTQIARMPKQILDSAKIPALKAYETLGDLRKALDATKQIKKIDERIRSRWKDEDAAETSAPKKTEPGLGRQKTEPGLGPKTEPEPPKSEAAPSGEGPTGGPSLDPNKEKALADSGAKLRELAKTDHAVATFVKQFDSADPASFAKLRQKMNPGEELASHLRGEFPENVKTVGDFMNALKLSEPKAEGEKGKEPTKGEDKPAEKPAEGEKTKAEEPPKGEEKAVPEGKSDTSRLLDILESLIKKPPEKEAPAKKEGPKTDKDKPKVKPSEEEQEVTEFLRTNGYKKPDFQDWADEDSSTIRDDSGEMLFPDERRKKHVPFDKLHPRAQAEWVDKFNRSKVLNENIKGLRQKTVTDANLSRTLKDLANPESDIRKRLSEDGGRGLEYQSIKKSLPELRDANLPPGIKTVGDLISAASAMHKLPPQPSRRDATPEEEDRAKRQIIENMPPDVAERLLESNPPLHPDDVRELVEAHSMAMGDKDGNELLKAIEGNYETDPDKVRPPSKGVNRHGEEVPFEHLSEGEQADAMQKHRMFVLGMSLAAREKKIQKLKKTTSAPDELLGHIADFTLSQNPHETPEQRDARAAVAAKHVFKDAIERGLMEEDSDRYARWQQKREKLIEQHQEQAREKGEEYDESQDKSLPRRPAPKEISEKQISKLLSSLKDDPASQRLAVGYAQANDYLRAQREFLSPDSPDAISEHESPSAIVSGMQRIDDFFAKADKRYPKELQGEIPAKEHFRNRILEKVRNLAPEKYPFVNAYVKEKEYDEYEAKAKVEAQKVKGERKKVFKDYEKSLKKWHKEYEEYEQKFKDYQKNYDPYRSPALPEFPHPPEPPEDYDAEDPDKPPVGYSQSRKEPAAVKGERRKLYDRLKDQPDEADPELDEAVKTASRLTRIVARTHRVSTCKPLWAMGDQLSMRVAERSKTSVYWGVEPYPKDKAVNTPYVPWTQVHQRDLDEKDFTSLVKAAREWLKTPVLSTAVDGIYRETQVRAALELAIRDHENGRYSVGLQPPIYNMLLARLTGESDPYALLPDRSNIKGPITVDTGKSASVSLYHSTAGEGHTMIKASALIRQVAVKYASSNPAVAYDLIDVSMKVAEQEQKEEQEAQGQQKQAQLPPEFLEQQKKKKEESEGKKEEQGQGQQKDAAFAQLKSAVIKMAQANPHLREAYRPLLETIKKLG